MLVAANVYKLPPQLPNPRSNIIHARIVVLNWPAYAHVVFFTDRIMHREGVFLLLLHLLFVGTAGQRELA